MQHKINQRIQANSLRTLKTQTAFCDFSSNDYLGFANSVYLKEKLEFELKQHPSYLLGATGSRLISGNSDFIENLESEIANFHNAQAGLIFNSGYDANIGLLSSIALKGDTIITDELIHASIIDGARLSNANKYIFKHNDLESLEEKLKNSKGNIFIVTESVFSMDGDFAPIQEISKLAKKYEAHLIIDEAHATGIFGDFGSGIVNELGLENDVFARVHTFGKALGSHGAIVLGSKDLRTYLINFARSFIYTTALPFHSLLNSKLAYEYLKISPALDQLKSNIDLFRKSAKALKIPLIDSESAIQCIIISGNEQCKKSAERIQEKGFEVKAILSPTVAEGKERLRICIHATHTTKEINDLLLELSKI